MAVETRRYIITLHADLEPETAEACKGLIADTLKQVVGETIGLNDFWGEQITGVSVEEAASDEQ